MRDDNTPTDAPEVVQGGGDDDPKPPAAGRDFEHTFQALMASVQGGPPHNPIADHITSEHIAASIDLSSKSMDVGLEDRKDNRRLVLQVFIASVVGLLGMVALLVFTSNSALLADFLKIGAGGVAGWAGGYGYGRSRRD